MVRVIVQKDSIISNLKTIQKVVNVPIIAVLKGNGYLLTNMDNGISYWKIYTDEQISIYIGVPIRTVTYVNNVLSSIITVCNDEYQAEGEIIAQYIHIKDILFFNADVYRRILYEIIE